MSMERIFIVLSVITVLACDDNNDDIKALQDAVTTLQGQVTTLQGQLSAAEGRIADLETAAADNTARLDERDAVIQITADGDVVVEGANLRIQNGSGSTDGLANGKGNLIVGYDEPRTECVGGPEAGKLCSTSAADPCTDSTCEAVADPEKTGSHNLIVGPGHRYSNYGSVVFGRYGTVSQSGNVLGGSGNVASARAAVVVSGVRNIASGSSAVVVGGENNTAAGTTSAILGGFQQTIDDGSPFGTAIPPIP